MTPELMSGPLATAVHISTVRPPLEVRVFHHECRSLVEAGYEIHLVVHDGHEDKQIEGIRIHSLGPRKAQRGLLIWSRLKSVMRARRRSSEVNAAAIIHLHDPELIPLGWWFKFTTHAKVIYDSAENYTAYMRQKYFLPAPIRWVLTHAMAVLETSAAQLFDAIVTADRGTRQIFEQRGGKRVVTVHNFPILGLFDVEPVPEEAKQFDLVYHGSIPKYHLDAAFDTAAELKRRGRGPKWLFVGTCHDLAWAARRLNELGLESCFEFKGRVHHDEVAPLVAQARIGFIPLPNLPKFQQNIPMKLFEFMALRMPVVLTDLPPSRPFAGDGRCAIMVPPDDAIAFADAIERLLDDPELRATMGAEGRRRVECEYNWSAESSKLIELYRELLTNDRVLGESTH